jgi:hypothetical protein
VGDKLLKPTLDPSSISMNEIFPVGSAECLKEMVMSVLQHVTNTHVFPENKYFKVGTYLLRNFLIYLYLYFKGTVTQVYNSYYWCGLMDISKRENPADIHKYLNFPLMFIYT